MEEGKQFAVLHKITRQSIFYDIISTGFFLLWEGEENNYFCLNLFCVNLFFARLWPMVSFSFIKTTYLWISGKEWYKQTKLEWKIRNPSPSPHAILSYTWFLLKLGFVNNTHTSKASTILSNNSYNLCSFITKYLFNYLI